MMPAPLTEELDDRLFGGKAAQLAAATRAGLPVPAGVALPFGLVDAIAAGDRHARQQLAAVLGTLAAPLVARSSAVGEDSEEATFAGQHLTRLNLRSEPDLVDAVCAIWDSARSPSALAYRERLRLPREPRMAVVVQGSSTRTPPACSSATIPWTGRTNSSSRPPGGLARRSWRVSSSPIVSG